MFSSASGPSSKRALTIALLYLVAASLWIVATDQLLALALHDPGLAIWLSRTKGLVFVAATALLLFLLLRGGEPAREEAVSSRGPRLVMLGGVFLGLALIVPVVGYVVVRLQAPRVEAAALADLRAVTDLKAGQIESWLEGQRANGEVLAASSGFVANVNAWLRSGDVAAEASVMRRVEALRRYYGYQVDLLDDAGRRMLPRSGTPQVSAPAREAVLQQAWRTGRVQLSDLYRDDNGGIHLDVVVPLLVNGDVRQRLGAVVLGTPVERFLFPLIQSWPTPSPSAETVLARRDGNDVLFLNELRHRKDAALTYRVSLDTPELPAARSILSARAQTLEGKDYRGVPVFASVRPLRVNSWHLVAKIDRDEVMAPLNALAFSVGAVGLVAVAAVATAVFLLWRQQQRTHRMALAAQALEKDRLLKLFYDLPFVGMSITSPSSKCFLHVNDRMCEMLGYPREELLQKAWTELTHPDDLPSNIDAFNHMLAGRTNGFQVEKRFVRKDGNVIDASLDARAVRGPDGGVQLIVAMVRDITERKLAEQALARSEQRYRSLFDNMINGFAYCRMYFDQGVPTDFAYIAVNGAFERLTGLKDVVGKRVSEVIPGIRESNPDLFETYGRVAGGGAPESFESYVAPLKMWFSISVYSPAPEHFVAVFDVITERKLAEEENRRLNAELERRVAERTAQLESLNQELESFTYSVSHDLKAPLRGIDGYSRLLLEDHLAQLDEEGRVFLGNVRQGAQQMSRLIEDLLAYSRMERRALDRDTVDPRRVVDAVLAEREADIRARGVRVSADIACAGLTADPDGLGIVLRNLVDNALKFTRDVEEPRIDIGGRREGDRCILWVKDNGIGFDLKYHDRIFEIFQRLQRAEDYAGTGIGLAIVRKAMQRMGGRAWAESAPGCGATFFLELPA